jgi:hypothetical protein
MKNFNHPLMENNIQQEDVNEIIKFLKKNKKRIFTQSEKVKEFVNRVIPEKYKSGKLVSEKGRILVNDEYLIADEILKNDLFFKVMRENLKEKDSDE